METRSRGWRFTTNNYTEADIASLVEIATVSSYLCYSQEVAPTTGTPHLQGYVYFKSQRYFSPVQKLFPRSNLGVADGTALQNRIYCGGDKYVKDGKVKEKNETFKEFGTLPEQGKRNDIKTVKDMIVSGSGMRDIIDIASNYQTLKTAELVLKYVEKPRNFKPHVVWIWGATGVGKTRYVYDAYPDVYRKTNSSGKWWDGYDSHEVVLLDDIKDNSQDMYSTLLELLDRYAVRVEGKGGSRQFLAKRIFVTSTKHPTELFKYLLVDKQELLRRIDELTELKFNYKDKLKE